VHLSYPTLSYLSLVKNQKLALPLLVHAQKINAAFDRTIHVFVFLQDADFYKQ
jgi:hypothetical protein